MKKIILTFSFVVCTIMLAYGQSKNSTQLYAAAIDTVLSALKIAPTNRPILVRSISWNGTHIKTYRGKYTIQQINGLKKKDLGAKKDFIVLNAYPIMVANGELLIMITTERIIYKSKNRWNLKPIGDEIYYAIFDFDSGQRSYFITDLVEGRFCPNTTDWENNSDSEF